MRLWGIADEPFWPALERLHDLADLGVLEVADLGREALERAAEDRDRGEERRVPVALDDLGADRVRVQPELGEHLGLDVRLEVAVRADGPAILPVAISSTAAARRAPAAIDLERPAGAA